MVDPQVVALDEAALRDIEFLEEQINEYNFATTGFHDGRLLTILLRDPDVSIASWVMRSSASSPTTRAVIARSSSRSAFGLRSG